MLKMRFRAVLMITMALFLLVIGCKRKTHKISKLEQTSLEPENTSELMQDYTLTTDGASLEEVYPDRIEREYIRLKLTQKIYYV